MTGVRSLAALAALLGVVVGAVWLSSKVDGGSADEAGAVSAAILAQLGDIIPESDLKRQASEDIGVLALCLSSDAPLDVSELNQRFASTLVRAIPASRCTSKTIEGDFGMFTAVTTWFDESSQEAGHLEIAHVRCPSPRRCIVDIDSVGAGTSFEVVKRGSNWFVGKTDLRWIV